MQVMVRLLALVALLASPLPVRCQVPSSFLQSVGMEAAWHSQLRLPIDGGHIVSVRFWVDKSQVHQYAVVDLGDQQIRISAEQLDRDGNPIGLEEAKRLAETQAARLLGKSDGFQVVEVSVPSIKMVVVTRDGLVQTLDAETGALLWASPCGPSWAPAHPAAVCEKGVVVVHGDRLYLLDWQTGKHRMVKSLRRATANAVIANEDVAFVSDFTGRIAAYGLGVDLRPWNYVMSGRAVGLPVVLPEKNFCAIATDAGHVYVYASFLPPEVWMRYESGYPITGSLTAGNGAFYVGNTEGTLAKFTADDRFGQIEWEYRTGHTITAPALVVGDRVFVVNESGEIDAIEDATGEAAWEIEGLEVKRALAVSGNLLFSVSIANELIAQEVTSGSQMGRTIPLPLAEPIINPISDRVYLVMEDGKLECLRPVGASLPTLVAPPQTTEPDEEQAPASSSPSTPKSSANPFDTPSGGTNPFDTAPAGGNPFGGGDGNAADPFGGGAGGADPFGNDPFGGGN